LREKGAYHANVFTEENDQPITEEAKRQISPVGQIVLYFCHVESLDDVASVEVPRLELGHIKALSQKAVEATVTPGDSLTCQTECVYGSK
jgi:hypothetical protein